MSDTHNDRLADLWQDFLDLPFPQSCYRRSPAGEDLVLLDSHLAGCVSAALAGALDQRRREALRNGIASVQRMLPELADDAEAADYFTRLRELAELAGER
ncbi:hypothetical protein [Streptomyces sp. TLI_171]|uniref:hypothetical protein n=1 Tax=Streptomyces sp. TLI_171 TaxID=1938859 RepID=UPI000C1A274B|nr:hypothetical protein [Streptomyces sp. TLI_171]RKE23278.1 hypothetical protein BX266_6740 [Streptomyces sp. TLI_171]